MDNLTIEDKVKEFVKKQLNELKNEYGENLFTPLELDKGWVKNAIMLTVAQEKYKMLRQLKELIES